MTVLEFLIAELKDVCAGLPDQRKGPPRGGEYTMADIGLSAFSVFFMGSPSFLAHQRRLAEGHGRSNCHTLFSMTAIPTDVYIRQMLDGAPPGASDPMFFKTVETDGVLAPFQRLDRRTLIALDGTECFCSRRIHCQRCSMRKRSDGGMEYFHASLGASRFCRCRPNSSRPRTERKSRIANTTPPNGGSPAAVRHLRPVFLGDDLFACQSIATAIQQAGGNFILTCKPASYPTITEYLNGAELEEYRQTTVTRGKRTTTIHRWLSAVPMRDTKDALNVNWFSVEIQNAKGKRTYCNSFVTDLSVTSGNVAELAACGRARW